MIRILVAEVCLMYCRPGFGNEYRHRRNKGTLAAVSAALECWGCFEPLTGLDDEASLAAAH